MTKGERIKKRREALGITQKDLADMVQSTKQNIYKYENNIITNIPSDKVEAIASALNTTPAYIMGWEEEKKLLINGDEELTEYLDMLRNRPECRMLFSITKDATKEDVEKAVAIIEALRKTEGRD